MHQIHENNDNKPNTEEIRKQKAYRKHLYNYSKKVVTIIHFMYFSLRYAKKCVPFKCKPTLHLNRVQAEKYAKVHK